MNGRKAQSLVVTVLVAIGALLITSLGCFVPASAFAPGCTNMVCNTWPFTAPPLQAGWVRDQRPVYVNGVQQTRTIDYRVSCETGVDLVVYNDLPVDSPYFVQLFGTATEPKAMTATGPGTDHVDLPQNGQLQQWIIDVQPWDANGSQFGVNYPWDAYGWSDMGTITCGTPTSSHPNPTTLPNSLQPNMTAAQAQKVCAMKHPGKWVARKKHGHLQIGRAHV